MITKDEPKAITKQKPINPSTKSNKVQNKQQVYIDIDALNKKYTRRWKILIWSVIIIFIVLTLIVAYILNVFNMAIYNPYETKVISVTSEGKDWYKNENINLFEYLNKHGEKIIWPGQSGSYTFIIQNTTSQPVYYKFSMTDKNTEDINMKYRLKMNNVYVIGTENSYVTIDEMKLDNIYVLKNSQELYTLEWKWEDSNNDSEIAKDGLATYTIYLDIYSKLEGDNLWK